MAKTTTMKKAAKRKPKHTVMSQGSFVIDTTIRFATKRDGKEVGRIQGKRFGTMVKRAPLDLNEWADAVYVSPRTLQTRIKENTRFDPLQSDRVELIMQVMERGKEVFGDTKKFRRWLDAPRPTLGGRKPIDMLKDLAGIGEVFAELGRVEHGVF